MKSDSLIVRQARAADWPRLRQLWQDCFGDSDRFMEYYYASYVQENEIWLLEDDGFIVSQLHLNPYRIRVGSEEMPGRYIVGVSTDERWRHRGCMTALLRKVFEEACTGELPFVYLMPASEDIYLPFQFAYGYAQDVIEIETDDSGRSRAGAFFCGPAGPLGSRYMTMPCEEHYGFLYAKSASKEEEYSFCAAISNHYLSQCRDIFTWRDVHYFRRLQGENLADGGDLLILYREDGPAGYLSYSHEEVTEIRDFCVKDSFGPEKEAASVRTSGFIISDGMMMPDVMYDAETQGSLPNIGIWELMTEHLFPGKTTLLPLPGQIPHAWTSFYTGASHIRLTAPIIMGRITCVKSFLELFGRQGSRSDGIQGEITLDIRDRWIPANHGLWRWKFGGGRSEAEYLYSSKEQEETCRADVSIDIGGLFQWLTGYETEQELMARKMMEIPAGRENGRDSLPAVPKLTRLFINEII